MAFPVTKWTLLAKATLNGDAHGREALNQLCLTYWKAVAQFIENAGWKHQDAEDLTQRFFVYLMQQGLVHRAESAKGTFRAFLKTVLRRFLADERDRLGSLKRGGNAAHVPLEVAEATWKDEPEDEFGKVFDRQWAQAAMKAALAEVIAEYTERRGADASTIIGPLLGGEGELLSYEDGAQRMALSLAAFKSEVYQWRRRLRDRLRAEVRRTVSAPHELEEEFTYLRQLLAG